MSDFDFDEIDKAVSGALNGDRSIPAEPQASDASGDNPAAPSIPIPASNEAPASSGRDAILPAARRSSGRFMDVVHPSSDMRTRASGFTPPAPSVAPAPLAPLSEPEVPTAEDSSGNAAYEETSWDTPLESPFLPDAKVEKRPLGGAPVKEDQSLLSLLDDPDELLLEAPDEPRLEATTMPDPIDFTAHAAALPSENEDTGIPSSEPEAGPEISQPADTTETEPAVEPEPLQQQPPEEVEAIETEPSTASAMKLEESRTAQAPLEPVGPTSITQQYTEQPSATQTSGAIYDTETYHQAITPVVRKKSGVWTILWIALLVILGAGAGVAVYLFVLPML